MPRVYSTRSVEERFWPKVERGEPDACWPWHGARCMRGLYGRFGFGKKSTRNAHTVAWELDRGRVLPKGKVVRHRCVNPSCCNPRHLVLGTQKQNIADMITRGRSAPASATRHIGEQHGRAVLRDADVQAMRAEHASGRTFAAMARDRGVSESTVARAVRGESWSHL